MDREFFLEILEGIHKLNLNLEALVGELHGINLELFEIKTILNTRLR